MKLIPSEDFYLAGCESRIETHLEFDSVLPPNNYLKFYVKVIPEDPDLDTSVTLGVFIHAVDSNGTVSSNSWETQTPIEEFKEINIPIAGENIKTLHIHIFGAGISDPLDGPCHNKSYAWIDGITIDSNLISTTYSPTITSSISVYPNPSTGLVNIYSSESECVAYELYSTIGQQISKGLVKNSQINVREKGTFILRLFTESNGYKQSQCKLIIIE